jgi:hypothetical protein
VSWDQRFDRPVVLPSGKTLRTLEDARQYILTLPKSEHETTAWQVAIEALLIAAEKHDPGAGISEPRQAWSGADATARKGAKTYRIVGMTAKSRHRD